MVTTHTIGMEEKTDVTCRAEVIRLKCVEDIMQSASSGTLTAVNTFKHTADLQGCVKSSISEKGFTYPLIINLKMRKLFVLLCSVSVNTFLYSNNMRCVCTT